VDERLEEKQMRTKRISLTAAVAVMAALLVPVSARAQAVTSPTVTVVASGLNNPRGLVFGPDGALYVAEGGTGGTASTDGQCTQVPKPIGPYTGGFTASISRISLQGTRTVVASGLPSSQTAPPMSFVSGVADVKFGPEGKLFALIAGAGCSHGLAGTSNELVRVHRDGSVTAVADLSAFLATHPVANPDAADFEPDGTWYSFVTAGRDFYAVEPNHQELDKITPDGRVRRIIDFSQFFPGNTDWRGPTAMTSRGGSLYIGTLTPFPVKAGAAEVFKVDPRTGDFSVFASGLSTVLGLAFGEGGALYVLEMSVQNGGPAPMTGAVVRIKNGHQTTIASGLNFPTAMTAGPDGNLYVSVDGLGGPPGAGQVVRITVNTDQQDQ
jgi:sugar lactone lactonase YvrE